MTLEQEKVSLDAPVGDVLDESQNAKSLQVTVNRIFGRAHVLLAGDLDDSTAPFLRQKLDDEVLPDPGDEVVLDIGLLSFIGSSGLSLFMCLQQDLTLQGSRLVIYAPTPTARRLFEITRMNEVITIEG